MDFKTTLIPFSEEPLTKQVLLELLKEYKRPFDKINELVKQGVLVLILREKINNVSMEMIKEDVRKFIKDDSIIKIWSPSYFLDLIEKMKFALDYFHLLRNTSI